MSEIVDHGLIGEGLLPSLRDALERLAVGGDGGGGGGGGDDDDDGGDGGDGARPAFRPDPNLGADDAIERLDNFLTQRAAQTLMQYYAFGRDTVRRDWLENWRDHRGLRRFHGHGGLPVPAAEYARGLLVAPPEEITIALKKRGAGHGGWSKNNPYLPVRHHEYKESIVPRDVGIRLVQVRADVAKELRGDLASLAAEDASFWVSYLEDVCNPDPAAYDADAAASRMPSALEGYDPVFSGESTPYRGGNYDLALSLATWLAARATLARALAPWDAAPVRGGDDDDTRRALAAPGVARFLERWLEEEGENLVAPGVEHALGGAGAFMRALCAAPSVEGASAANPTAIARAVLAQRSAIVAEWCERIDELPAEDAGLLAEKPLVYEREALENAMRASTPPADDAA